MTMVSTEELAVAAELSSATIRRYCREGLIPARVTPGGHRRFDKDEALLALERIRLRLAVRAFDGAGNVEGDASAPEEQLDPFDVAPTPTGECIVVDAVVTVLDGAESTSPMTTDEWLDLVEVLDADY